MTDPMPPRIQFSIGIIVERRRSKSPWLDFAWAPVAALPGSPEVAPWTLLFDDGEMARFFGGSTKLLLYRTESNNYRENLLSAAPSIWVALRPTGTEPAYSLFAATVDPAEGESFTQAGQDLVGVVPLPPALRELVKAFTDAHPSQQHSYKRRRDETIPIGAGTKDMAKKVRHE